MELSATQKIIFLENTSETISNILKEYKILETPQQLEKKLLGEDASALRGEVILDLALAVIEKKFQKEGLSDLLQKQLGIPAQTAARIAKDIEEKLIIKSKKVSLEEWKKDRLPDTIYSDESGEFMGQNTSAEQSGIAKNEETIKQILKNNGLEEDETEASEKVSQGRESRSMIIKDALIAIQQRKISEERLAELLQKHLETSKETAEKIIQDINQKIILPAKTSDLEENTETTPYDKEKYKEELLDKVRRNKVPTESKPETADSSPKNPSIKDVEDNAKNMEAKKNLTISEIKDSPTPMQTKTENKSDPYKESIE